MVGVVLAGGAGRRMGRPKALVAVDGVPMARRVADAMLAAGAREVVLQGGEPANGSTLGLEVVPDRWPGEGPLAGLASAVAWARRGGAERVLVAACDQPALTPALFSALLEALPEVVEPSGGSIEGRAAGAVAVTPDGRLHPFPAAWSTASAADLEAAVVAGSRRARHALELGVVTVPWGAGELLDIDTPEDLQRYVDGLGGEPPGAVGPTP